MDSVKTFFSSYTKDSQAARNQQTNYGNRGSPTAMTLSNGLGHDNSMNAKNQLDPKRKDNDKYFYILWHS